MANPVDVDALLKRLTALGGNQAARAAGRTNAQPVQPVQPQQQFTPIPTGTRLSPQTQIMQNSLTERARQMREIAPQYQKQIEQIAAGGSAATGPQGALASILNSTPAKAVLNGLNTIGIPLRAVTSTIKEAKDALDSDPNTKASTSDFINQIKDPSFGFGRVVPMKGWKGRVVGFLGDLVLDPVNYLTLGGGAVLKGAQVGARGVLRAGVTEAAEKVALRTALGTKTVSGRAGREALADLVRRYGGNGAEVKAVLSRGKSAVPTDIAEVIGLGRSGLYVAGTKLRLPGSGPLAQALEAGLTKTRLGIVNTRVGENLQKWVTPRGTGSVGVRDLRADAAAGRISPDEATTVSAFLGADGVRRTAAGIAKEAVTRRVVDLMADPNIDSARSTVFRIIEDPTLAASESERVAAARIKNFFAEARAEIDARMKSVDPGWQAGDLSDYFPHMLSDDARKALESSFDNPKYEQLMTYLKIDPRDLQGSLKQRTIGPNTEFLGVKGDVHKGTIEGLNKVAREKYGFDLFETDAIKVLAKYTDVVAETAGTAAMLNNLKDAGVLKLIQERGMVDPEFTNALQKAYDDAIDAVDGSIDQLRSSVENLVRITQKSFDPRERGGVLGRLVRDEKVSAQEIYDEARRLVEDPDVLQARLTLAVDDLNKAIASHEAAVAMRDSLFSEQNALIDVLNGMSESMVNDLKATAKSANDLRDRLARGEANLDAVTKYLVETRNNNRLLREGLDKFKDAQRLINFLGNDFGPELQRLTNEYGTSFLDQIFVDGKLVSEEMIPVRVNYPDVPAAEKLMGEIFDPRVRTHAVYGGTAEGKAYGLGENWIREIVTGLDKDGNDIGTKAVFDKIDSRLASKSKVFARRGEKGWTVVRVNDELARGVTVGDNEQGMAEAFYWMTLREMKYAYERGGYKGVQTFSQELLEGVTPRAKLWNEAATKVQGIADVSEQIRIAGAKAVDAPPSGNAGVDLLTIQNRIAEIDKELEELREIAGPAASAASVESLRSDFNLFTDRILASGLNSGNVSEFKVRAIEMLEELPNSAFDGGKDFKQALIDALDVQIENSFASGGMGPEDFRRIADTINETIDDGITRMTFDRNKNVVASANKKIVELNDARNGLVVRRDKLAATKANDPNYQRAVNVANGNLREQIADMADSLANYYIFHEAYLVAERAQALLPPGVILPDSVWSVTLRNVSKEQSRQIGAFRDTVEQAYEIMSKMQRDILDRLPREKHAAALYESVRNMPKADREIVEKVFGVLDSGARGRGLQELDRLVNVDPEYVAVLNELQQIEVAGASMRPASRQVRTTKMAGRDTAATLRTQAADEIASLQDKRSLKNRARITIDVLEKKQLITADEAQAYRMQLDSIRNRVKTEQDKARAAAGIEGSIRDVRTTLRGRSKFRDTYGVAGLFDNAVSNIANGTGRRVEEFFAKIIGGGQARVYVGSREMGVGGAVYTGVGGKYRGGASRSLERQYQLIERGDSIIGRMEKRLTRRQNMLASISIDPTIKPAEAARVGLTLTDDRGLLLMGDAGWAAYLEQRIADAEAALKQYRDFDAVRIEPYRKAQFEPKTGKARKGMTEADAELERTRIADNELYQMSQNPDAISWIDNTLAIIAEPAAKIVKDKNNNDVVVYATRVASPPKELNIPDRVVESIRNIAAARDELALIEARPNYLAAKERRRLHDFMRDIADYDLSDIRNANGDNVIDVSPSGSKLRFVTPAEEARILSFANSRGYLDSYTVHQVDPRRPTEKEIRNYLSGESTAKMVFTRGDNGDLISDEVMVAFLNNEVAPTFTSPDDLNAFQNLVAARNAHGPTYTARSIYLPAGKENVFDPSNSVIIFQGRNVPDQNLRSRAVLERYNSVPESDLPATLGIPVDKAGNPIVFNPAETMALYERPRSAKGINDEIKKLTAEREKIYAAASVNRERNQMSALFKRQAQIEKIDARIAELNTELLVTNPDMRMAQVQKAQVLKAYFEREDVQRALGFGKPVSGSKAVERYLQLHPEANVGALIGDERKATLLDAWKNSYENSILRRHSAFQQVVSENSKILKTARSGGLASEAIQTLRALNAEKARLRGNVAASYDGLIDDMVMEGTDAFGRIARARSAATISGQGASIIEGTSDVITPEEVVSQLRLAAASRRASAKAGLRQPPEITESLRQAAAEVGQNEIFRVQNLENIEFTQSVVSRLRQNLADDRARLVKAQNDVYAVNERLAALDIAIVDGKPVAKGNKVLDDATKKVINEKIAKEKALKAAEAKLVGTENKVVEANARFNAAQAAVTNRGTLVTSEQEAFSRVQGIKALIEQMKLKPPKVKGNKNWQADFDEWVQELEGILAALDGMKKTAGQGKAIDAIRAQLVQYAEIRTHMLNNMDTLARVEAENASMLQNVNRELMNRAVGDVTPALGITFAQQLEEGFAEFGEQFPNLQANPKILEIFNNANRLKDPAFARAMQRFLSPYTRFFKAWAVATPGFHVRNSISNAFMLVAAGGRPDYLLDGLKHWRGVSATLKAGKTIDDYVNRLAPDEAASVRTAFEAFNGSGGGQAAEVNIQFGNKLYSNKFTKKSQEFGIKADDHARFMLAYDGARSGMDFLTAAARVRRFLIDYQDTSTADAMLRQIIPFWMWTSRNLPLQMVNIWANPRAYRVFTSFKNNFEDRESGELMPKWMKEAGAFMIPGTSIAATPDLPFSRIGQQVEQLRDPKRLAADVNPLLRVPLETFLADKKFFSDIPFREGVREEVSGPVGLLASYLGQPFGQGTTGPQGERLVSDRFLYGLTNLLPLLNQAERLIPSRPEYQERGIGNQLAGYFGVPARRVTDEMQQSELRRRLRAIADVKQRLPEEE